MADTLTPIGGHLRLIVDRTAEIKAAADKRELRLVSMTHEALENWQAQTVAIRDSDKLRLIRLRLAADKLRKEFEAEGVSLGELDQRMRKALGEAHG